MNLKEALTEFYKEIIFFTIYTIIIFFSIAMFAEPVFVYIIVGFVIVCIIIIYVIINHQTNKEYEKERNSL